ncbi:Far upstream element-binding protein 1 [Eumeta japonica]|uniref:Far upstream element-binding protein 1 n=1 Tax=Eumeta variegata TaxID=151549 RepID=A0A4C1YBW9_EUMVA|nr:Far upstream element-binding protein 1 [Eumeta japonica]
MYLVGLPYAAPDASNVVGPERRELVNLIVNHRGRENAPQHQDSRDPMGGGGPGGAGGAGGPGGGGMLRGGGLSYTEEITIPGPKVGLIIGKNGKTIKQLQEQSGAKMVVIQEGPNTEYEKPLRITGDQGKVEHAKQLVFELLAEKDLQFNAGPRPYDDPYQQQEQGNGLATNSAEVLVPKIAVGVVIGRGGDMIKKIQAETGCRVQFHQERDEGPGDKRCYLQGKPHQVDQARQMIEDLIESVNGGEAKEHRLLLEAYNEAALSERICREWFLKFKNDDFDVEDKDRSGRPKLYEDAELEEDSSQTQKKLALTLEVTQQAVSCLLK